VFAVWYLFDKDDEDYLFEIITNLSKQYDAPSFIPHITAYGLLNIDLKTLDDEIIETTQKIKSFSVETNTVNFSDNFWKTLFVEILPSKHLVKINNNLAKNLSQFSKYEFLPHISLLYKNMEKNQKQFLAESLDMKKNFKIIGMGIQQFSENIKEWKLVRRYQFNKT
jgi:hypothetical protein